MGKCCASSEQPDAAELLTQTALAQPALFVVEYAMAQLWRRWGVEPVAVGGHSVGEYVAATLAGVFSLEDALRLVPFLGGMTEIDSVCKCESGLECKIRKRKAKFVSISYEDGCEEGEQQCLLPAERQQTNFRLALLSETASIVVHMSIRRRQ